MEVETGAMLIAILALVWQMHQNNKQAKLNFFTTYTQRYQDIVINLPIGVESDTYSLESIKNKEKEKTLRWLRAYFDLCSEEYHLYKEGLINKKIWELWEAGMKDSLKKPAFREAWTLIQVNSYYAQTFTTYVSDIQSGKIA